MPVAEKSGNGSGAYNAPFPPLSDRVQANAPPPLAVDLDGTLVLSDTLHESILALLRSNPLLLLLMPLWLIGGKARFKREIARRVVPEPASLPYNRPLLDWLHEQRAERRLILASAADAAIVNAVADHLQIFDEVLASDGERNVAGNAKSQALMQRFGKQGFDYAGNSRVDLDVWRHAQSAIVVNASTGTRRQAQALGNVTREFPAQPAGIGAWLRALRLHQWVKNLLVFVPLLSAHLWFDRDAVINTLIAFVAFSLCASSVYLLNDLMDLPSDREHPRKRHRPFASGLLPLAGGVALIPLLLIAAFTLSLLLPDRFTLVLAGYYALTLAYTFVLKRIEIVDVVVLACLYTSRIIAGAVAIPVAASFWLLAFTMFLFLSLALVKRYAELVLMRDRHQSTAAGRGYQTADLPLVGALGVASGYLSVLVLALYVNSGIDATGLYGFPKLLWLLCPLLLYWISRAWMLTHRGCMHDDPLLFAVRDRISQVVLAMALVIVVFAL